MSQTVPIMWDDRTSSYAAACPDCGKCIFMVSDEAILRGPRRRTGSSLLLPVTMTARHDCEDAPHDPR